MVGTTTRRSLHHFYRHDPWLRAMDARLEAARAHDRAAAVFARRGDLASAEQASAFAASERAMHEAALARHPEWVPGESDPPE
jgi:hypothetical protein